jgi:hypothetical protein
VGLWEVRIAVKASGDCSNLLVNMKSRFLPIAVIALLLASSVALWWQSSHRKNKAGVAATESSGNATLRKQVESTVEKQASPLAPMSAASTHATAPVAAATAPPVNLSASTNLSSLRQQPLEAIATQLMHSSQSSDLILVNQLNGLCLSAKGRLNDKFSEQPGKPPTIDWEGLLRRSESLGVRLDEGGVKSGMAIVRELTARCGRLGDDDVIDAIPGYRDYLKRLYAIGRPAASMGYRSGAVTAEEYDALVKVFVASTALPAWLASNDGVTFNWAEKAGYGTGLTGLERRATIWLANCELGGDCGSGGITRASACIKHLLCGGNSLLEAIEQNIQGERLRLVSAESHRLASDIALKGFAALNVPRKP